MLGNGRAAELESVAEFTRGQRLVSEDLEQLPPHGVCQRRKHVANAIRGGHTEQHTSDKTDMSTNPDMS